MNVHLFDSEKVTIEYYDKNAQAWAEKHSDESFYENEMKQFKEYLPEGSILEIGSGVGKDAIKLIQMGYVYTGIDASEGLIKEAHAKAPLADFLVQNVYDLKFQQGRFDGFWCAAMLLHIPKDKIHDALQQIRKVVKKGGVGFISLKEGTGEYCDESMKRAFYLYSVHEFTNVLVQNGFTVLKHGYRQPRSTHTTDAQWVTFFVQV